MKTELEKKLLDEQLLKEKAENKIIDLEQEEIEIMKRIRTTTQVHKASKFILKIRILYILNLFILKYLILFYSG